MARACAPVALWWLRRSCVEAQLTIRCALVGPRCISRLRLASRRGSLRCRARADEASTRS
eukprot:7354677-Alexandrium_andersonii.AAC.1